MTPIFPYYIPNKLNFGTVKGRKVVADFSGGQITSDAGIVLIAELDKKLKITAKFAECFQDYRDLSYVNYSVHKLLAQRVYGIILGYEDVMETLFSANEELSEAKKIVPESTIFCDVDDFYRSFEKTRKNDSLGLNA